MVSPMENRTINLDAQTMLRESRNISKERIDTSIYLVIVREIKPIRQPHVYISKKAYFEKYLRRIVNLLPFSCNYEYVIDPYKGLTFIELVLDNPCETSKGRLVEYLGQYTDMFDFTIASVSHLATTPSRRALLEFGESL